MRIVAFIVATVLVAGTGAVLAAWLRLPSRLETLLAWAVLALSVLMGVVLVLGLVVQDLRPGLVVAATVLVATAVLVVGARRGELRGSSARVRALVPRWGEIGGWAGLRRRPWHAALAAMAFLQAVWNVFAAWVLPPYAWDGLTYHLPAVGYWVQHGRISITPYLVYSNTYPLNAELVFAWPAVLLGEDSLVDLGQLPFAVMGALATAVIARAVGTTRAGAVAAGSLFFLTPIVLAQVNTAYVDVALAGAFLAAFAFVLRGIQALGLVAGPTAPPRELAARYFALGGLAAGMAAGTKGFGVVYVMVLLALVVLALGYAALRRGLSGRRGALLALCFVLPLPLLGSFWFARNWVEYGNPAHPFDIEVAGISIWEGPSGPPESVLVGVGPPELEGKSAVVQVARSWIDEPHAPYAHDQRLGGLGLTWTWLAFPTFVAFAGWALWRRRDLFLTVVVPFAAVFALQAGNWWSRFTIVIVAPGVVAVVYAIEHMRGRFQWLSRVLMAAALAFAGVSFVTATPKATFLETTTPIEAVELAVGSPSERTIGKIAFPEFAWVDDLPEDATIATRIVDVPNAMVYALFGRGFEHRVVMLDGDTGATLRRQLARHPGVDIVYTVADSPLDRIARSAPDRFEEVTRIDRARVYRVRADR